MICCRLSLQSRVTSDNGTACFSLAGIAFCLCGAYGSYKGSPTTTFEVLFKGKPFQVVSFILYWYFFMTGLNRTKRPCGTSHACSPWHSQHLIIYADTSYYNVQYTRTSIYIMITCCFGRCEIAMCYESL